MDIFTQKKLLVRIVVLLTILNLGLMGIFIWKDYLRKPSPPDKTDQQRDISKILERELKLTGDQVDQIRNIRDKYAKKENELELTIRAQRDSMNSVMFNSVTNEVLVRSLARMIAENEFKMEILRFEQAKEFKSVCNPAQLEKFESFIREIRDYLRTDKKPIQVNRPKQENRPNQDNRPRRR